MKQKMPKNTRKEFSLPLSNGFVIFKVGNGVLDVQAYDEANDKYIYFGVTESTSQVDDLAKWMEEQT